MIKLENVSKFYYNQGLISSGIIRVSLELNLGEFVVITGESGSGKSTLLNVISGIDSYEEGEMYINGKETSHYGEKDFEDYRRKYIANIFQNFNLVNSYTVYQNVELALLLNGYKKKEIKNKVLNIIDKVGLTKFKNTKVSKLSGGQKQRVAIARAVAKDAPIIVADEPTGNLDSKAAKEVLEILKDVAKDKLVVIVTHNIEQVENLATRIVKMHDGKIIEDSKIKNVEEPKEIETSKYCKVKPISELRLGIRNTFNIASKFLLLFAVFFFTGAAVLAGYGSFQMSEKEASHNNYSPIFKDLSENRIIFNKKSREPFTNEDYEKIMQIENVDYIEKDDIFIDSYISLQRDTIGFVGGMHNIANFEGKLDTGRMPEKEDEIILEISKDQYNILHNMDKILNNKFSVLKSGGYMENLSDVVQELVIVGIKYSNSYDAKYYVSESVLNNLRTMINKNYSIMKIIMNNKYQTYTIEPSDLVPIGGAIVDDDFKYSYKNGKIKNTPISINVKTIYYTKDLNLNVTNTYTKNNIKRFTGVDNYNNNRYKIFINTNDYNSLYNTLPYQSSLFVKDVSKIDKTISDMEEFGLSPKKITDYQINEAEIAERIIRIIKVVVTILLLVVLFFISYLIVKVILKSRNLYYTTLRMLGASYKNVQTILNIELFINASLAYFAVLAIIKLSKSNLLNLEYIAKISNYLSIREYALMYIVLIVMSLLISNKFSKKLFKKSALTTYNEEV